MPNSSLTTLMVIVLLPCLPAFLLFKALPSRAAVKGPLRGLEIKLGGAFGGYFALVVLILASHNVWNPVPTYQVWKVTGDLSYQSGSPAELMQNTNILAHPPCVVPDPSGAFEPTVYTMPGAGGTAEFPKLTIDAPDYLHVAIPLGDKQFNVGTKVMQLNRDEATWSINLGTIELQKVTAAYGSTPGVAPVPISESH